MANGERWHWDKGTSLLLSKPSLHREKRQIQMQFKTAIFATGRILQDLLFYNGGETHGISTCGEQPFPINHRV